MFEDLYDAISFAGSPWWPSIKGKVTAVDIERLPRSGHREVWRLAVAYGFSIGDDGPYSGESFWQPAFFARRRVVAARHKLHVGAHVLVRYRRDDPSINKLDRTAWRDL